MQTAAIMNGARKVVRLARVKAGEKTLIVADDDTADVAEVLKVAALEITPDVVITFMTPRKVDGDEPPAVVAAALLATDVALIPVGYSISHSTAVRNALQHGARVLSLPAVTPDQLLRGGVEADFEAASPTVRRVAAQATRTTASWTSQASSRRSPTSRPTSPRWTAPRRASWSSTAASRI